MALARLPAATRTTGPWRRPSRRLLHNDARFKSARTVQVFMRRDLWQGKPFPCDQLRRSRGQSAGRANAEIRVSSNLRREVGTEGPPWSRDGELTNLLLLFTWSKRHLQTHRHMRLSAIGRVALKQWALHKLFVESQAREDTTENSSRAVLDSGYHRKLLS